MRIKETIKISVKLENQRIEKVVNVEHDGIEPFKEWPNESKQTLKEWVQSGINEGKKNDWLPFANFESSVQYNINTEREKNIDYLINDYNLYQLWNEDEFKKIPYLTDQELQELVNERKDFYNGK
jgi:hypothetical protein